MTASMRTYLVAVWRGYAEEVIARITGRRYVSGSHETGGCK
jgi:hypothetical protein